MNIHESFKVTKSSMNIHNGFTALVTKSDMALPMNIHNGITALETKSDMALTWLFQ